MQHTFDTPGPTSLYVELGSGDVTVRADKVTQTTVNVDGKDADDVTVEQRGGQIVVIAPNRKSGFFSTTSDLTVTVTLPTDSALATKLGSADLVATGRFGTTKVKSGSGDVHLEDLAADTVVETGSGDIAINAALDDLRIKTGSGDVQVNELSSSAVISTGSGDVALGRSEGQTVVKSGSGDISVKDAHTNVSLSTASGDLRIGAARRGAVEAKGVSGDVRIGVPAGVPVWTDVSCVTGRISSNLEGAGQPEEGQDFIEIRAKTVSGDIALEQL